MGGFLIFQVALPGATPSSSDLGWGREVTTNNNGRSQSCIERFARTRIDQCGTGMMPVPHNDGLATRIWFQCEPASVAAMSLPR